MYSWSDMNSSHYLASFAQAQARQGIDVWFHPFTYELDFLGQAAGSVLTDRITIEGDSDFICFQTMATDLGDDLRIRLRHGSSGRELMSERVQVANIFGSGAEPFYWFYPLHLERRASLHIEHENALGSVTDQHLGFHGVKVFSTRVAQAA